MIDAGLTEASKAIPESLLPFPSRRMIKSPPFPGYFLNTRKSNERDSPQLQYPIQFGAKNPEMDRLIKVVKGSGTDDNEAHKKKEPGECKHESTEYIAHNHV